LYKHKTKNCWYTQTGDRPIINLIKKLELNKKAREKELPVDTRMYRMSSYIWDIKHYANGTIKVTKEGRKVSSYQLMNVDEVQSYMIKRGLAAQKQAPAVQNLQDLKAEPVVTEVQETPVSA
jgi:hypothetical protein